MVRLIVFIVMVATIFHYLGYLDWDKFKGRLSGDNKGVGDFYDKSSSGSKPIMDKFKDTFSKGGDMEVQKPPPPSAKPVWSEGVSDPKKMNIIKDDQRYTICFYPDIPESCSPLPKKK